ncbi:hypothetical protein J6590_070044 [Homalodisca vitripennis]|nr:hypothetical protein J6590_070044 [Homalodisca vitripennis]
MAWDLGSLDALVVLVSAAPEQLSDFLRAGRALSGVPLLLVARIPGSLPAFSGSSAEHLAAYSYCAIPKRDITAHFMQSYSLIGLRLTDCALQSDVTAPPLLDATVPLEVAVLLRRPLTLPLVWKGSGTMCGGVRALPCTYLPEHTFIMFLNIHSRAMQYPDLSL